MLFRKEIVLADGGRGEGVRLDDVRPGLEILPVDFLDDLGLGDVEQVIETLQILRPGGEPGAAIIGLGQLVPLNHRAHGPINDDDAFLQQPLQCLYPVQFHVCCSLNFARKLTKSNAWPGNFQVKKSTYQDMKICILNS